MKCLASHYLLKFLTMVLIYDVPEDPEKLMLFSSSPTSDSYLNFELCNLLFFYMFEWGAMGSDEIQASLDRVTSKVDHFKEIYYKILQEIDLLGLLRRNDRREGPDARHPAHQPFPHYGLPRAPDPAAQSQGQGQRTAAELPEPGVPPLAQPALFL